MKMYFSLYEKMYNVNIYFHYTSSHIMKINIDIIHLLM